MASSFVHAGAVLRYEFLIQWRQRVALLASVALCALCLLLMLGLHDSVNLFAARSGVKELTSQQSNEAIRQFSTLVILSLDAMLHFFSLLLFPIILADTFPKDTQYGVRELLDTLPLSTGSYLIGKVLAAFCTVLIALALPMIVLGVGWWLLVYPYDISAYLGMWIIALVPVGLINTGLCILIASGQPTRRRAILIGIVFAITCLLMLSFGLGTETGVLDFFNLSRPLPFKHYIIKLSGGVMASYGYLEVTSAEIAIGIVGGIAEVLFAGVLVQRWMTRRLMR